MSEKKIRIENRFIGNQEPPFVIAEAGINHNGKLKMAKELVDAAVNCKADAVKFQTFWDIGRLKKYELTRKEFVLLKEYCDFKEIIFLSTPHSYEAIEFLENIVPAYKISSGFLTDYDFLYKISLKEKPIILSTGNIKYNNGMATYAEIKKALNILPDSEVILLQCVSKYPCFDSHVERTEKLKRFNKITGLSDHTKEFRLPSLPIIEKHLMLREYPNCVDYNVSIYPSEFKRMVRFIHSDSKV